MKKQFIYSVFILMMTFFMASCGNKGASSKGDTPEEQTAVADTSSASKPMAAVYQCPMKCEGEKTYDAAGKCPKCGMDLKEVENHEGHSH